MQSISGVMARSHLRLSNLSLGVALACCCTQLNAYSAHATELVVNTSPAPSRVSAHALLTDPTRLADWLTHHSPELLAERARVFQASADVGASRVLPNPVLDASLGNIPVSETTPAGLGFGQVAIYGIGIGETIEIGKRGPRIAAAELREHSARLRLEHSLGEQLADARLALATALHAELRVAILKESLKDAEGAADLEHTRFEHSGLSGVDYDRLLLDLAGLRADVSRAESEYQGALAECAATVAGECDLAGATDRDLDTSLEVPTNAEALLPQRADVRALGYERQAAERDAELARARAIPDPTLHVGFTHDQFVISGDNRNTLAVSLALPLPVFDHGQHDAAKAQNRALELERTEQALILQTRAALSTLVNRKEALQQTLNTLEQDSLPRSESVLTATSQAFDQGGVSLTDLLLARRTHINLEVTRLDLRFELFGIANELARLLTSEDQKNEGKP